MTRKFASYKPTIYIKPSHYDIMLWMVNQPNDSQFLKWRDEKAAQRIIVDKDHGLDAFSAFYADIYLRDRCSTRLPVTLQKLYDCHFGLDIITDSWALDIAFGAASYEQLQKVSDAEEWHPEVYNDILYKIRQYYKEC